MFCKAQCGGLPRYCAVDELGLLLLLLLKLKMGKKGEKTFAKLYSLSLTASP